MISAEWAEVLITFVYAVTTVGIFIANYQSSKVAKGQLQEQKQATIIAEKQHKDVLAAQREEARVAQMPYFFLSGMTFDQREGHLVFRINLENCGNGSAVAITLSHIENDNPNLSDVLTVYRQVALGVSYIQTDTISKDFAKLGEAISFELLQIIEGDNCIRASNVEFTMCFQDMFGNEYSQKFWFNYRDVGGTGEHIVQLGFHQSKPPSLVKKIDF